MLLTMQPLKDEHSTSWYRHQMGGRTLVVEVIGPQLSLTLDDEEPLSSRTRPPDRCTGRSPSAPSRARW